MKRSVAAEMMDSADNPRELLEEDLLYLRQLNRYLGGARCLRYGVAQLVRRHNLPRLSILDVGAGSADVALDVVRWCRLKRIHSTITTLERDPVTVAVAANAVAGVPEISVVRGDAAAPPFAAKGFDCVIASQFLHHFSEIQIIELLRRWAALARRAIIIGDLLRHPLAYYGIQALTRLSTRNIMTLTDAPLSVRRAFTLAEWRELFRQADVGKFQVTPIMPFRMSVVIEIDG